MTFGSDIGTAIDAEIARQIASVDAVWTELMRVTKEASKRALADMTKARDEALAEVERLTHPTPVPPVPVVIKTLFGAGGGNVDRSKSGIKVDRRYYDSSAGDLTKAIADIKRNAAAGIITWLSFKTPFSWIDMSAGRGDAWFTARVKALSGLGPVWLSIHHEPEGDADEDDWRTMQDRLSRALPAGIKGDIKYILTVTGWGQEFNTNAVAEEVDWETNLYPHGAPIYAIAYDSPYNKYGFEWAKNSAGVSVKTTKMDTTWTTPETYVDRLADRAAALSKTEGRTGDDVLRVAIGETAYSDEAFAKDRTWWDKVCARAVKRGLIGVCYFDTPLNSKRSWYLGAAGSAKRVYVEGVIRAFNA